MKQKSESYLTLRILMSLVHDVAEAQKNFEAIEAKVAALAKEYGVRMASP